VCLGWPNEAGARFLILLYLLYRIALAAGTKCRSGRRPCPVVVNLADVGAVLLAAYIGKTCRISWGTQAVRTKAWRIAESKLREREVVAQESSAKAQQNTAEAQQNTAEAQQNTAEAQRSAGRWQIWLAVGAMVAAFAAAFSAYQSRSAVGVAEQGIREQDAENQLSTAVTALGGATAAQRVAGVTLLEGNVAEQLALASNEQSRQNAYYLYMSAIIALANYLRSGTPLAVDAVCPTTTLDVEYTADELKKLLDLAEKVVGFNVDPIAIDLSRTELCSQDWTGINFDWVATAYLWKIDLRGAYLQHSYWGRANLSDAQFQCADLSGADLRYANLAGADLRGAYLVGAGLPKTLKHAQLVGAITDPRMSWNRESCLENSRYWDPWNAPATTTNVRRH
jgi:hypothetical protein